MLVCLFVTLLVLMQKPSANSGMGAALGGGAAEQAFGGEATNVLTRGTIYAIIAFFLLSFGLYLGTLANSQPREVPSEGASISKLTEGEVVEEKIPAEGEAAEGEASLDLTEEVTPVEPSEFIEETESEATAPAESVQEEGTDSQEPLQLENLDRPETVPSGS